jgi:DNA repair exonuclease SbcCD nuclease subunit
MGEFLFPEFEEEEIQSKPKSRRPEPEPEPEPKTKSKPQTKVATKPSTPSSVSTADDRQRAGLLFIGDPHLEGRVPGFRSDDFPNVALRKFRWCLDYARRKNLLPVLLGDLFQLPRDNPNWLLSEVFECLDEPLLAIYGNHDVRENTLNANDSINLMFKSGHLRLLTEPWVGTIGSRKVLVGGSPWGTVLPSSFAKATNAVDLVVWVTHHDITVPGYDSGRLRPDARPGIDLIINGHIHRRLETVSKKNTHWMTPGNITRRVRSDAARGHVPAVLELTPVDNKPPKHENTFAFRVDGKHDWVAEWIEVPHAPFDEVFHSDVRADEELTESSGFIADLTQLTNRRTDTGAGLIHFLKTNLTQFEKPVADEIMRLANEVTCGEHDE